MGSENVACHLHILSQRKWKFDVKSLWHSLPFYISQLRIENLQDMQLARCVTDTWDCRWNIVSSERLIRHQFKLRFICQFIVVLWKNMRSLSRCNRDIPVRFDRNVLNSIHAAPLRHSCFGHFFVQMLKQERQFTLFEKLTFRRSSSMSWTKLGRPIGLPLNLTRTSSRGP
jgi:hypothetical protein